MKQPFEVMETGKRGYEEKKRQQWLDKEQWVAESISNNAEQ